jgi:regulatory protein
VRIHLSDGSFYVLHAETWARSGLDTGSPVDPDTLAQLLTRSERIFARRRALALLSRAAHTRAGLARKLAARGFSGAAIRHAIARMTRLGYLDDRAFAEAWLRSRLSARADGWKALYRGLIGRGVPRQMAADVAREMFSPEAEMESARRLATGLSAAVAIRKLSMRGYRSRAIAQVAREIREKGRPRPEE